MTSKFSAFFSAAALIVALGASAPAIARDNGTAATTKTVADLEGDGYTCTRIATGFTECTKKGADTYWCSSSTDCGVKPRAAPSPHQLLTLDLGNQVLSQ